MPKFDVDVYAQFRVALRQVEGADPADAGKTARGIIVDDLSWAHDANVGGHTLHFELVSESGVDLKNGDTVYGGSHAAAIDEAKEHAATLAGLIDGRPEEGIGELLEPIRGFLELLRCRI